MTIDNEFPNGLLQPNLYLGILTSVSSASVRVNLEIAGLPSGTHFTGYRYGRGEVGEFVLIEAQLNLLLGRIVDVKLPEAERKTLNASYEGRSGLDAFGNIQLLGTVSMDSLEVAAGVDSYPRLGDRVYAAPVNFVSKIPTLMEFRDEVISPVLLSLGAVDIGSDNTSGKVKISPEKIFGRHCAILGSTGGGKSWTTSKLIEESIRHPSKVILLDPTGEYRAFSAPTVEHYHIGTVPPDRLAINSQAVSFPHTSFNESDFSALFKPSSGVQLPKFREAIVSLRAVAADPTLATPEGTLLKQGRSYTEINQIYSRAEIASVIYRSSSPFDVTKLVAQLKNECVWENANGFGNPNDQQWGYCSTLVSRITNITNSRELSFVFNPTPDLLNLTERLLGFLSPNNPNRLFRLCLSGLSYEFDTRQVIANAIGRFLLNTARIGMQRPVIIFLDEAHNFIGKSIGDESVSAKLDSFELIAREGRKYGLNICLATQRPRDLTEGVLSQIGTLVVHRLTNDRDREVVERACGEIDRSASSFLPNLRQGEAAILGADFPIPLTIQMDKPIYKPLSDGPDYQSSWSET